ncbi:MAG: glutamine--fructose-6-phosphate transaminase (isomerizing), partial [Dehalococcoidales bacterium]|nr:glutamine--fructose-6-phosphate transaminase (isomerizing) [Dehalococcoidales bacterium]
MCGIVGYIGDKQAQPILLNCLSRLEYRGYDSCGIAVSTSSPRRIEVYKDAVRVGELAKVLPQLDGTAGIGHTRWATHGEPSQVNAHPHCDCTGSIAVVHNGVINNFQRLKQQLIDEGHNFVSETDTEVIAHLVEEKFDGDLLNAVKEAMKEIK